MNEQVGQLAGLDRVIHEPARLMIMTVLSVIKECDFIFLLHETGLNKGTLSSHLSRLEEAGYVDIKKTFRGRVPRTLLRLTPAGRRVFEQYRKQMAAALLAGSERKPGPEQRSFPRSLMLEKSKVIV